MKAQMKLSVFLIAVIAEIKRIKRLATPEEIDKLNFSRFEHWSSNDCIYGQMTGHCSSDRARIIAPKKFADVDAETSRIHSNHKYKFKDQSFDKGTNFTALEKYLYMCPKTTHKHIIDFLKGKVKTLDIK